MADRIAVIERETAETKIKLSLNLDGQGTTDIDTGIGFLDHMLTHIGKHSLSDLTVKAKGDLQVDAHHTTEDIGIVLGQAIKKAIGNKEGIVRYGSAIVPMDEALVLVAMDLCGRSYLGYDLTMKSKKVGNFDTELANEFFVAVAQNAAMTLHIKQLSGNNTHHILEAAFKAFGKALDTATRIDERIKGVPSTKGVL